MNAGHDLDGPPQNPSLQRSEKPMTNQTGQCAPADDKALAEGQNVPERARRPLWQRLAPLALIALGIAMVFAFDLDRFLTFEALREHRMALQDFVAENPVLAPLVFMLIYATSVALSLPGGAVLTIAAGFLFGTVFGTLYVVVSATLGAVGVFLIAQTALGDVLKNKAGKALAKMRDGFHENALSYLLILRLIPLFPFFVVNVVPAFLGVPLRTYIIGTFFGIIPGTFVFASVGAGLGSVFDAGEDFSASNILTPEIITALIGLAVLSALPIAYKKLKKNKA